MRESRVNCLVLFAGYTTRLSYYDDWLDAFSASSCFATTSLNICQRDARKRLIRAVRDAELIVLLHSTNGVSTMYLEPLAGLLQDRKGILVSFVGNELNLPGSPIAAKRRVLGAIEPDIVASQLPLEAGAYLFGDLVRRKVISLPHALNPKAFRFSVPQSDRTVDIGVRAARYPPHLGDNDRNRLHDVFAAHDFAPSLVVDIGTQRFARPEWATFLNRCRGTVSSEAGSWYLERDDATVEEIRAHVARQYGAGGLTIANDSPLRRLGHKLPWPVRAALRRIMRRGPIRHEAAVSDALPFDDIYERFFAERPRCPVYSKCISSRHFDAIGTGTVQVLLAGRYNDILVAGRHYLELAPDYANIADVMERFSDTTYRNSMANEAHECAMSAHTYDNRIMTLREELEGGDEE